MGSPAEFFAKTFQGIVIAHADYAHDVRVLVTEKRQGTTF